MKKSNNLHDKYGHSGVAFLLGYTYMQLQHRRLVDLVVISWGLIRSVCIMNTLQFGSIITHNMIKFHQNRFSQQTLHNSLMKVNYGVAFLRSKSAKNSNFVPALQYAISFYMWPRYDKNQRALIDSHACGIYNTNSPIHHRPILNLHLV